MFRHYAIAKKTWLQATIACCSTFALTLEVWVLVARFIPHTF